MLHTLLARPLMKWLCYAENTYISREISRNKDISNDGLNHIRRERNFRVDRNLNAIGPDL